MSKDSYAALGASATKSGLHQELAKSGIQHSGLFAPVLPDLAGNPEYSSFLHCDGAGTKSIVAYLLFRETSEPEIFAGLAEDATVMNLDDIYCLGKPDSLFLANAIARNAHLVPDEAVGALIRGYRRLVESLETHGISIALSGGETADCGDVVRTLLVDAVLGGRIKNANIINADSIVPGDAIIAFASTGTTSYDPRENSGIGSNGLTLARHALLSKVHAEKYPEVLDPAIAKDAAYRGPFLVTDTPNGLGMSVGEALLCPTRTYSPVLSRVFDELHEHIHACIHTTGGALGKVLRFGKGNRYIKDQLFPTPKLFSLIQEHGGVSWREMYQVFNMGHRMEIYLPEKHADAVLTIANSFGLDAKVIGRVEKAKTERNELLICDREDQFEYQL